METAPPPPKNDDADITVYFKIGLAVLYYIAYPIYKLGHILSLLLLQVLRPVWAAVHFVSLPFTYLAGFVGNLLSLPFRVLAKLEAVYIFLGIAVLIGLGTGLVLSLFSLVTASTLQLDDTAQPKHLRSLSSFRAARDKRQPGSSPAPLAALEPPSPSRAGEGLSTPSPMSPISASGSRARGHLSTTKIERAP